MLFVFQKETSGDNLSVAFFVEGVVYENGNKEIFIFRGTPASATPLESHPPFLAKHTYYPRATQKYIFCDSQNTFLYLPKKTLFTA